MNPPEPAHRLAGVQALRGLAALLVVFVHYNGTAQSHGFGFASWQGIAVGGIGVDLFFVISGFIMELTAGGRSYRSGDTGRFLARRAARVLPLYWTLTLIAFGASLVLGAALNSSYTPSQLLLSMLLLPATGADGSGTYVISVAWTLTFELYFYLLFAALLTLETRRRIATLGALFIASIALGLLLQPRAPLLRMLSDPMLLEFVLGCLLADAFRRGVKLGAAASGLLALAAAASMLIELRTVVPPSWRIVLWGLPAFALVAATVFSPRPMNGLLKPVLVHLGEISYSLYLSHFFTVALFARMQQRWAADWLASETTCLFAFCALSLVVAELCYALVELPARRLASRRRLVSEAMSARRAMAVP